MSWDPSPILSILDGKMGPCFQPSPQKQGLIASLGWPKGRGLTWHIPGQRKPRSHVQKMFTVQVL